MNRRSFKDRVAVAGRVLADRIAWREQAEPVRVYEATPLLGTVLVSLAVYFGGSEAAAAYAVYYFWVGLAACYFLRPAVAAAHLALASAGYGIAVLASDDVGVPALKWALATGSLFVVGILIATLRSQM